MIVKLIKKRKIYNFFLPIKVSGNYWITDKDYYGNNRNLINVEEHNGEWKIKSDFETKIMLGEKEVESAILKDYGIYLLKINTDNEYVMLYCSPSIEKNITKLRVTNQQEILIGSDSRAAIYYNYPMISKQQAKLIYINNTWVVQDLNSKYGTYVNDSAITKKQLEYGDIIFIMGLKIVVMKEMLVINNIPNYLKINDSVFQSVGILVQKQVEFDNPDEEGIEFYKEDDYFYKSPRLKTGIEEINITIDSPPGEIEEDKTPLLFTIGPMLTMAMTSMITGFTSITGVINGTADWTTALPSIVLTTTMLTMSLLFPLLQRNYQKKLQRKSERERNIKYSAYLQSKRELIQKEMKLQRETLIDNYVPLSQVKEIVYQKKRNLWEREITQEDFLDLRLGLGTTELKGNINVPEEHFTLKDDELLSEVYKIGAASKMLENVPIVLNLVQKNLLAIIGTVVNKKQILDGLLLQVLAYHSYEDLKIVVFTNKQNEENWEYLKLAPHTWNNEKTVRYFATNIDEAKEISLELEKEMQARKFKDSNGKMEINGNDYRSYKPYYLVITDDYKLVRDIELVKDICEMPVNFGFSLIVISPRLVNIPNECKTFVSLGDRKSGIFESELISTKQQEFVADFEPTLNMLDCCQKLANIPIDIIKENRTLPQSISFLEMYNIGMVEHLNILNRWKINDPTKTLQAPVGVDQSRELFKLDIHEKAHGPHGLIAGITGAGKSEFIITYILSMAINYHPYEVSFVLIDYKGGGLTGAFENRETGIKLPHLAGTITNLDTVEMNRALASVQSELRKRQRMFNEARDRLNESTIDIYKYQSLYRRGLVTKPISHLLIISDEFAELKDQRPEFMEQLISTARIGRALGVHLILATQKPSGVVNDQIWSNSRFRICLRVQDKSDSMDMIKCPDAAEIKTTGRFYLQVGYNELFAMGQAAWAGAKYYPMEKRKKKVDQSINIVDNLGNVIKAMDTRQQNEVVLPSHGEEVTNILKYIVDQAKSEKISVDQLWLDRIPNIIYIDQLKKKYNYQTQKNVINPIIGEYDDPDNQLQNILTLPLSEDGNTIIYGAAGSGKELMLSSIIYSCISTHDSKEVNFYILDFGAETLTMFKEAPHVGEVILSIEAEKISNLFKMIDGILEERKKIFVDYNGSYDFYIHHGGKQIPLIVIVINNVEAFFETYSDYEEIIGQMTRDCLKYGIIFIFSTNGSNTVRYRLRQNFKQNIALQFNDAMDYSSVIPGARKKEPSKVYGRGLVQRGGVFEFQTAYAYAEEKMADYIKIICKKLNKICEYRATKIPILPEVVTQEFVSDYLGNLAHIPIGVEKESLGIATINLRDAFIYNITGEDVSSDTTFLNGLINNILTVDNLECIIFDSNGILEKESKDNLFYDKGECRKSIDRLKEVYNGDSTNTTICLLMNINSFFGKLEPTERTEFTDLINQCKNKENIKFIIIDTIDVIKSINYEPWYKGNTNLSEGIWLGNGIANQFVLKITTNARAIRGEVAPGFGYIIYKGKAALVKLMSDE